MEAVSCEPGTSAARGERRRRRGRCGERRQGSLAPRRGLSCGRVVVITGSDSGSGLDPARQAAAQGAIVVLAARNAEALEEAAEAVRREGAREVLTIPTDVSKQAEAERLIDQTVERFGRIEVLINTAGLMLVGAEPTLTLDDFRTLMDVNFWGAVYTSRAALRALRGRPAWPDRQCLRRSGGRFAVPHDARHDREVRAHGIHEEPAPRSSPR